MISWFNNANGLGKIKNTGELEALSQFFGGNIPKFEIDKKEKEEVKKNLKVQKYI